MMGVQRLHSGAGLGIALCVFLAGSLMGCGPKCELEKLEAGWTGLGEAPTVEQTLSLLGETCPVAPTALLEAGQNTQVENLALVMQCAGSENSMSTTGDSEQISVREALWNECRVESMDLGEQRDFTWSAGRPDIALALNTFLKEQGASNTLVQETASAMLGRPMLPSGPAYQPLELAVGASRATEPATERLSDESGALVAVAEGDKLSLLFSAIESHRSITLVGLSSDGDSLVELTLPRDETEAITAPDQLSIWLHPGQGVTAFNGDAFLGGGEDCPEYSVCQVEGEPIDWKALAGILPENVPSGGARIGLYDGDLELDELVQLLSALGPERSSGLRLAALPSVKPTDIELSATARWLSGLPDHYGILDASLRANATWKKHAALLNKSWEQYDERHLDRIREWMPENLGGIQDLPLFYPFSGPDILNAVTFFPNQDLYVMAGLEPIGATPRVPTQVNSKGSLDLDALRQQLLYYLKSNYFITWQMLAKREYEDYSALSTYAYNSTRANTFSAVWGTGIVSE